MAAGTEADTATRPELPPRRTILFLQGLATPFFAELGAALVARGHSATG